MDELQGLKTDQKDSILAHEAFSQLIEKLIVISSQESKIGRGWRYDTRKTNKKKTEYILRITPS